MNKLNDSSKPIQSLSWRACDFLTQVVNIDAVRIHAKCLRKGNPDLHQFQYASQACAMVSMTMPRRSPSTNDGPSKRNMQDLRDAVLYLEQQADRDREVVLRLEERIDGVQEALSLTLHQTSRNQPVISTALEEAAVKLDHKRALGTSEQDNLSHHQGELFR